VTIDEEDESEVGNGNGNGNGNGKSGSVNGKTENDVTAAPVADIEDTVGDIDMRVKKMEALDKIKLVSNYFFLQK
jgi:hypothetical protein